MTVNLQVRSAGQGPALVLLHGLFGSGANLGALARSQQAQYTVHSVDLPNHGRSGWLAEPTLTHMADSLLQWLDEQGLERVALFGHSLGGKVAMELALRAPQRVAALVVADIAPVTYEPRHQRVFAALEAVARAHCGSRDEVAAILDGQLTEPGVAQFLMMSLQRSEQGDYTWRFDREGLQAHYGALSGAPGEGRNYPGPVLFIKGANSDYIREEHREAIMQRFPQAQLRVVPGTGHWLHADKPDLVSSIVSRFLSANLTETRGPP